jgi:hypothetical protein
MKPRKHPAVPGKLAICGALATIPESRLTTLSTAGYHRRYAIESLEMKTAGREEMRLVRAMSPPAGEGWLRFQLTAGGGIKRTTTQPRFRPLRNPDQIRPPSDRVFMQLAKLDVLRIIRKTFGTRNGCFLFARPEVLVPGLASYAPLSWQNF